MDMAKTVITVFTKIQFQKKSSFKILASLFITLKLPRTAVQNLTVFKCQLLHIQSLSKEYFLGLLHTQAPTHRPPPILPTHPDNSDSRVQSNINLSHLKGYLGFYFDLGFLKKKQEYKICLFQPQLSKHLYSPLETVGPLHVMISAQSLVNKKIHQNNNLTHQNSTL